MAQQPKPSSIAQMLTVNSQRLVWLQKIADTVEDKKLAPIVASLAAQIAEICLLMVKESDAQEFTITAVTCSTESPAVQGVYYVRYDIAINGRAGLTYPPDLLHKAGLITDAEYQFFKNVGAWMYMQVEKVTKRILQAVWPFLESAVKAAMDFQLTAAGGHAITHQVEDCEFVVSIVAD